MSSSLKVSDSLVSSVFFNKGKFVINIMDIKVTGKRVELDAYLIISIDFILHFFLFDMAYLIAKKTNA